MFGRQQGQADLARGKVYVGMTDGCDKLNLWRRKRIVRRDLDSQQPEAAAVGRGWIS